MESQLVLQESALYAIYLAHLIELGMCGLYNPLAKNAIPRLQKIAKVRLDIVKYCCKREATIRILFRIAMISPRPVTFLLEAVSSTRQFVSFLRNLESVPRQMI